MDPDLVAAVARAAAGEKINVSRVCRAHGISRSVFYHRLARFRADGVAGLAPRSRAPHSRPSATAAHVVEVVIRARKELAEAGWDHGAQSIRWHLLHTVAHAGAELARAEVPSRATIHRLLVARGQVLAQPRKRPRRGGRRFVHPAPNALWQIDGTTTALADGHRVTIVQVLDDHSRLDIACHAATGENTDAVWAALTSGFAHYGHPACVLSDNGTAFSAKRRGGPMVAMERRLAERGITTIVSSIGHPQTCGKNERAHQTLHRWLAARPAAPTLEALQALLETYRHGYNHRPHQALAGHTPHQRFHASARAVPAGPAPRVAGTATRLVSATGVIGFGGTSIGVGRRHAGHTAQLFWQGDRVTVLIGHTVAASLTLDRQVRYQQTTTPNLSEMC